MPTLRLSGDSNGDSENQIDSDRKPPSRIEIEDESNPIPHPPIKESKFLPPEFLRRAKEVVHNSSNPSDAIKRFRQRASAFLSGHAGAESTPIPPPVNTDPVPTILLSTHNTRVTVIALEEVQTVLVQSNSCNSSSSPGSEIVGSSEIVSFRSEIVGSTVIALEEVQTVLVQANSCNSSSSSGSESVGSSEIVSFVSEIDGSSEIVLFNHINSFSCHFLEETVAESVQKRVFTDTILQSEIRGFRLLPKRWKVISHLDEDHNVPPDRGLPPLSRGSNASVMRGIDADDELLQTARVVGRKRKKFTDVNQGSNETQLMIEPANPPSWDESRVRTMAEEDADDEDRQQQAKRRTLQRAEMYTADNITGEVHEDGGSGRDVLASMEEKEATGPGATGPLSGANVSAWQEQ